MGMVELDTKEVELRELWRRYVEEGDERAREGLVVAYAPLVKYVAGRMASNLPSHVEEADLVSYGLGGLIGAIERFDPERKIKFETFALTRIRGAIIDELRTLDWVPRSVRTRARELEKVNSRLENRLGRTPTDEELADGLNITEKELQESLVAIANSAVLALDELWRDSTGDEVALRDTISDPQAPDPERELDSMGLREQLAETITGLPERERLVIGLYYYRGLTLREIGQVLGVTESRVSQLHTKAVLRLRSKLD
jgi:RNA polymerase sigma factor for flagellar operon FliA